MGQALSLTKDEQWAIQAIVHGQHHDPFSYLGMHQTTDGIVVRAFLPQARVVTLIDAEGKAIAEFDRAVPEGLFIAKLKAKPFRYRLRVAAGESLKEIEDPYRFPPLLGDIDFHLMAEGNHLELYRKLGAHEATIENVPGVVFSVWAPNAQRVSVVGPFNGWDGCRHPMRCHFGVGVWEIFLPGLRAGALYKYEIKGVNGDILPLKADPLALSAEHPPSTASIVGRLSSTPPDPVWAHRRAEVNARQAPMSILEVHLGSWRRKDGNRVLSYRELAEHLVPYARDMGFTHLELMPVMEHPFDGSWGYQPLGLFAPTSRYGTPEDFRSFVRACHDAGLGVFLDWVPAHFPEDAHGLVLFDGTHLYEHADERLGRHPDWGSLIYNLGRRETANFLIANALYWIEQFEIDGLRVDAVASLLYLDYSRAAGQWLPNKYGGRENLEAIEFLRRLNHLLLTRFPGTAMIAEESTAWPMVTRPPEIGGLGFSYKWNLGWMHDTLDYFSRDPVHRKFHHNNLTFGLLYAFHENFILPLSHDEVVHGKGSLFGKMAGDFWQKFANLRAYYGFMFTQPGKKLLFMGDEFAQSTEWNHDRSLDWHLLEYPEHKGIQALVRDLNHLYRSRKELHELDCEMAASPGSTATTPRRASFHTFAANMIRATSLSSSATSPVVRSNYRIGVPKPGTYRELINTDSSHYGGSNVGNSGAIVADGPPTHGHAQSLVMTLPPLATLILEPS